ncbi:creatininase family protein [Cohnella abietis]|uniref:Creatininase n=1 Tax=Cohnella abietis TaxID=2507935 RepID=A0A3T1DD79_9BACL|nr:creatininase family protein [Cohnella abietis]BBI35905.1 creatininase [Cohnella abietis]
MENSIFSETMANMTWVEIEKSLSVDHVVLLPSGILEQHGPHLTLAPDIYFSCEIAKAVKKQLIEQAIQAVIAPPTYWGITRTTAGFPGSFILRKETLKALMSDILVCLHRWGARHIYIIDVHDDITHRTAILEAVQETRQFHGANVKSILSEKFARESKLTGNEDHVLIKASNPTVTQFTDIPDIHAGALESSFIKQYYPHAYRAEACEPLQPTRMSACESSKWEQGWIDAREVNPLGYYGDPAKINMKLAQRYIEIEGRHISAVIQQDLDSRRTPSQ